MPGLNTVRIENQRNILDLIRRCGTHAQVDLARVTGLGSSTVSMLVRDLKDWGLVEVVGKGSVRQRGGKPAEVLSVADDAGRFLTLLLEPNAVRTAQVDLRGVIRGESTTHQVGMTVDAIVDVIRSAVATTGRTTRVLGIGIAVASIVDAEGRVHPSAHFDYRLPDLRNRVRELFETRRRIPLVVENDANCAAYFAYQQREVKPKSVVSLLFQNNQNTVGAGIILNGTLHRGFRGSAGEILPRTTTEHTNGKGPLDTLHRATSTVLRFFDPEFVALCGDGTKVPPTIEGYRIVRYDGLVSVLGGAALLAAHKIVPFFVSQRSNT